MSTGYLIMISGIVCLVISIVTGIAGGIVLQKRSRKLMKQITEEYK